MSEAYRRTYRETLSRIYLFICSIIVVVSMVASLFSWVDVTVLLDYTWTILLLCFTLSIVSAMMKEMLDIHLLTKHTFISIMKNTLYGYCVIVGTLCPFVIYGVSFDTGFRIFIFLQLTLIILYIIAYVVDRSDNK